MRDRQLNIHEATLMKNARWRAAKRASRIIQITSYHFFPTSLNQEQSIDPFIHLTSTPSKFCYFGILAGFVTNWDLKKFMELDLKLRKKFGAFRYFVYPFYLERQKEFHVKIRYPVRLAEQKEIVCRTNCGICDHANNDHVDEATPLATSWSDAIIRISDLVMFWKGPLRNKFSPRFGMLPHSHTGDGLLHILPAMIMDASAIKQMILQNDFHMLDCSKYHVATTEFVVEQVASVDELQAKNDGASPSRSTLFAGMDESIFPMNGPLHFKVITLPNLLQV